MLKGLIFMDLFMFLRSGWRKRLSYRKNTAHPPGMSVVYPGNYVTKLSYSADILTTHLQIKCLSKKCLPLIHSQVRKCQINQKIRDYLCSLNDRKKKDFKSQEIDIQLVIPLYPCILLHGFNQPQIEIIKKINHPCTKYVHAFFLSSLPQ